MADDRDGRAADGHGTHRPDPGGSGLRSDSRGRPAPHAGRSPRRLGRRTIARFVLRRLGLAVITLFVLSFIIFFAAQVLPGDVGRRILGPVRRPAGGRRAERGARHQPARSSRSTGTGSAASSRATWATRTLSGFPVSDLIWPALANSVKLALLAFVIVVPLGDLRRCARRAARGPARSTGRSRWEACPPPRSPSSSGPSSSSWSSRSGSTCCR